MRRADASTRPGAPGGPETSPAAVPRRGVGGVAAAGVGLLLSALTAGAAPRQVAVTFDDLPANSTRSDVATHRRITAGILEALGAASVPAIGFVNEVKLETEGAVDPQRVALLEGWLDAGHELGNHTYSHPSLYRTPLDEFVQEVLRGERVLRPLLEKRGLEPPRYFRHPFLNTGPTTAVRDGLRAFLAEHGYRVAPVTIDNQEWIYARAYDHVLDAGDRAGADRLAAAYLDYMMAVFDHYEAQADAFLGRPLKHILLLHANRLNADHGGDLLARLAARDYRFITLERALTDPAYRLPDDYAGPGGITWLHRWALTAGRRGEFFAGEPEAPDWVRGAARVDD